MVVMTGRSPSLRRSRLMVAQRPRPRGGLAAGQGADAQHELGEVKRLGEVLACPG